MNLDVILSDPDILGGTPVFQGTRVPIDTLFMHLEKGVSVAEFLDDFPSVRHEQVVQVLAIAERMFASPNFRQLYESAA